MRGEPADPSHKTLKTAGKTVDSDDAFRDFRQK